VYLGAVFDDGHMAYATVNVNAFDESDTFPKEASLSVNYDHETEEERRARRRERWTPVVAFAEGSDGSEGAR
jgi:hypothetical protein